MQIFEQLCETIRTYLEIDDGTEVTRDTTLLSLGADSLDVAEIVMDIEDRFDITVPDGAENKIHTLGDVEKLISELLMQD